jgi:hypothetical protein
VVKRIGYRSIKGGERDGVNITCSERILSFDIIIVPQSTKAARNKTAAGMTAVLNVIINEHISQWSLSSTRA